MTKGEIQAVLFVAASMLVGALVLLVKQFDSDLLPDLDPATGYRSGSGGIRTEFTATTDSAMALVNVSSLGRTDIDKGKSPGDYSANRSEYPRADPGYSVARVPSKASPSFENQLVPVNSAPASELQKLPGIGPRLAERIIAFRNQSGGFSTVEQLLEVKGIGPARLDRLRPLVVLK